MRLRFIVHQVQPGEGEEKGHRAEEVEDPGPAGVLGEEAADGHGQYGPEVTGSDNEAKGEAQFAGGHPLGEDGVEGGGDHSLGKKKKMNPFFSPRKKVNKRRLFVPAPAR